MGHILLLAAGLLVLTVISAGSVHLVNKAREDARAVVHTLEVENQISLVQLQLRRAESAQRGYVATLRPDFQTDFERAISELTPALTTLSQLISDNPVQRRLIAEMMPLYDQRIEEFRTTNELARSRRMGDAAKIVREGNGRDTKSHNHEFAGRMRAEENRLVCRAHDQRRSQPD